MSKDTQYFIVMPQRIAEILPVFETDPPKISGFHIDNLRQILSILSIHIRKNDEGWTPLQMLYLRKQVPQADLYLKYLIDFGIIERNNHYRTGQKSYHYRFTDQYVSGYISSSLTNPKLITRIEKCQNTFKKRNSKKYPNQNQFIRNLTIENEALNYIERELKDDPKRHNYALASAIKVLNGDIFYSVDTTSGRYHSNLTNMPKTLRQFVRINGKPLTNVDIKNSQPYLSTLLLTNPSKISGFTKDAAFTVLLKNLDVIDSEDIRQYVSLVTEGEIYEFLWQEFKRKGLHLENRDEVKRQVFIILFAQNRIMPRSRQIFKELFPEVHRIFNLARNKKYNRFPILLQRIESYLILDVILKRINEESPGAIAVTIHDSVMTTIYTDQVEIVKEIMEDELTKFVGYEPKLKVESKNQKEIKKKEEGEREGQYDAKAFVIT